MTDAHGGRFSRPRRRGLTYSGSLDDESVTRLYRLLSSEARKGEPSSFTTMPGGERGQQKNAAGTSLTYPASPWTAKRFTGQIQPPLSSVYADEGTGYFTLTCDGNYLTSGSTATR